ncbi:dienelactone hydrolase [Deinococcus sp. KNUC1210]|uniref:alpha/beta hydrolase family protein n=1 Tax=Deinococcus sp. KNUC1210 TaxID=2917691 RepID=UPI001EF02655|nr:dienelactone hydrolase [Deinococcus sp. KNUC1210]ULH15124.1 dienelactone hydrolase [Deinococcus sp. KNUC1210]
MQGTPSVSSPVFPGDLRPDAPELSARGPHAVGVRTLQLTNKNQLDIAKAATPLTRYDRPLTVEVWYPATLKAGETQVTSYPDVLGSGPGDPKRPLIPFQTPGRAARNAGPEAGRYPLVIVSHGYPGSRVLLSYLCENLASKGYVVASIDHTDSTHADKAAFASTLLNRPLDDQFVLDSMGNFGKAGSGSFLSGIVDADNTALVGYSMGGYGALNFAGAGFAKQVMGFVPGGALAARSTGAYTVDPRLKAVVAFAPWGGDYAVKAIGVPGAAEFGFWDAAGLAAIKVPTLFVVGDHDDVAGYVGGVQALFQNSVNSDRYMVVYQNARHNSAPNPPPPESVGLPDEYGHYAEPAWDMGRLNNLNEHFVTAFLNYRLKGQADAAAYLNVKSVRADAGVYSRNADGTPKPDDTYWKGFPARSAVGIELYHLQPK